MIHVFFTEAEPIIRYVCFVCLYFIEAASQNMNTEFLCAYVVEKSKKYLPQFL